MKMAPVADVKAHFSAYLKSSQEGLVVVTRNGKPSAVILGITDEDEIERLSLAYSPKFNRILDAARRDIRKGKGIPHDEFWTELEAPGEKTTEYKKAKKRPGKGRVSYVVRERKKDSAR